MNKREIEMNKNQKEAIGYLTSAIRRLPSWQKSLAEPEILARWAGFTEWMGGNVKTRFYFNDPAYPNESMYGHREGRDWGWIGGHEGSKRKADKEMNKRNIAVMQAAMDAARVELAAFVEERRDELPIFGEGAPGEVRTLKEFPEIGEYVRLENGKWERRD